MRLGVLSKSQGLVFMLISGSGVWDAILADYSAPLDDSSMGLCDGATGFDTSAP